MSLTIAEAAERTGLSAHTLRYYERDGLMLRRVPRSTSGHRTYTETDLGWIQLITKLRATGMPIRDVRRYTDLVRAGEGTEAERLAILQRHRDEVSARLREVTNHMEAIEAKIAYYAGHIDKCAPPASAEVSAPRPAVPAARH